MLSTDKPSSSNTACEILPSMHPHPPFIGDEWVPKYFLDNLYEEEASYNLFCVITLRGVTDVAKRTR